MGGRIRSCVAKCLPLVLFGSVLAAAEPAYTVPLTKIKLADGATVEGQGEQAFARIVPSKDEMRVATAGLGSVVPGEYEIVFRAAAPAFSHTSTGIRFIVYCKGPSFRRTRILRGVDAPLDGSPFETRAVIQLGKTADLAFEVDLIDNQARSEGKHDARQAATPRPIPEFSLWPIRLVRTDKGAAIERIRSQKVYYKPGEAGSLTVRVRNVSDRGIEGTADLELIQQVAHAQLAGSLPCKLAPGAEQTLTFPFATDALRFGVEARVRVREGDKVLTQGSDFFSVHDEFWAVGLGSTTLITGHSGLTNVTPQSIEADIERLRSQYVNWWEKIFWPPDDWGDMTPETENWMSGQSARWESATNIRTYIQALKPHGIKSITYGKHVAMGPAGWELVRRKPEWFYRNGGRPSGNFHTEDLYTWNDLAYHSRNGRLDHKTFHSDFWTVSPDLRQEEVVMHGIREMTESARRFGWDGVRFDGHWTAGNDALSTAPQK